MRVGNLHVRRVGCQDHVLQLDCVLGQRIHEVDVELTQEQRVVLQDDHHDPQSSLVELLKSH